MVRLIQERGIDATTLYQAIVDALEEAYAGRPGAPSDFRVNMYPDTFTFSVTSYDDDPNGVESPLPEDFTSRVAADKFSSILKGRVLYAEKESAVRDFSGRIGTVVEGVVRSVADTHAVVEVAGVAGELSRRDQIPQEVLNVSDVVSCYLADIIPKRDLPLKLMRSNRDTVIATDIVYAFLSDRIQEIADGSVQVLELDREPGRRTKVVVGSRTGGVRDAVAAVVGANGRKINAIQDELANERIDVCGWSEDPKEYLADLLGVEMSTISDLVPPGPNGEPAGSATVYVSEDEMGRVLGTKGSNVRMAERIARTAINLVPIAQQRS